MIVENRNWNWRLSISLYCFITQKWQWKHNMSHFRHCSCTLVTFDRLPCNRVFVALYYKEGLKWSILNCSNWIFQQNLFNQFNVHVYGFVHGLYMDCSITREYIFFYFISCFFSVFYSDIAEAPAKFCCYCSRPCWTFFYLFIIFQILFILNRNSLHICLVTQLCIFIFQELPLKERIFSHTEALKQWVPVPFI